MPSEPRQDVADGAGVYGNPATCGEPQFKHCRANGVELARWEWAGETAGTPPVIFCHATGFHGHCWDEVVRHLDPSVPVTALDMRGHGRSEKTAPPMRWRNFGEDTAALGDQLGWRDAIGVGHSMGGYAVALAAALRPGAFRALVLLDPVIMAPESYTGPWVPDHYARKRRRDWESADEMYARFHGRGPFESWNNQVLRDYCDHALNGHTLACPPEVEGSIYENCTMPEANIYQELKSLAIPVLVIRSAVEFVLGFTAMEASPTNPQLATILAKGQDLHWRDVSHFIPMEAPERVAEQVRRVSADAGESAPAPPLPV
jgi:lipase